ncbi:MAG: universal stress protein [Nitrososphaerales archaeon]|jgi:nucleotide-binding universal stress UspA family protein
MSGQEGLTFRKIMVAFDGSKDSVRAVDFGCSLAEKYRSTLVVVHVYSTAFPLYSGVAPVPVPEFEGAEALSKEKARGVLADGIKLAEGHGMKEVKGELLEASSTVQALLEFAASEKVDLIVVGTRGMTGFKKLILGSVSSGLVSHSECPILVVR